MAPYFSIILPVYNVAPYLERCIRSVLEQSFQDYEILLVDDGSPDRCPRICDDYAQKYPFIRVLHKENGGLASARNAGLEMARGRYIWWVDSDDFIEPGALALLHERSAEDLPDLVKFSHYRVEKEKHLVRSNAREGLYLGKDSREELLDKAFSSAGKYCLSAWSHIYRRDFLEQHGLCFVSERIVGSEDYLFNLEALYAAGSVRVVSEALYCYEMRDGSLTRQYKNDLPERYGKLREQLQEWYRKAGAPQKYEKKINSFFLWHLIHGTCIPNEYAVSRGHTTEDGRRGVRRFLAKPEVQSALRFCDLQGFSRKQRLQLLAMRLRLEGLFYWLYVEKPKAERKRHYEDQN